MVLDSLAHLDLYRGLHGAIGLAADFLKTAASLSPGRYELGGGSFVLVQEGETREAASALFEAHDRYLDLQVIGRGAERVEWADRAALCACDPIDPDKDIGFYRGEGEGFDVGAGMFYLVFPHDAHKPCCHTRRGPGRYRKYVFKLLLEPDGKQ